MKFRFCCRQKTPECWRSVIISSPGNIIFRLAIISFSQVDIWDEICVKIMLINDAVILKIQTSLMSSIDLWILISKQVLTYNYFCKNVCITFWTWILAQLDELYRMAQLARRSDEVQILLQAKDAWMLTFRHNIFTWQHYFSTCDHFLFTSRYLGAFNKEIFALDIIVLLKNAIVSYLA